MFCRGAWCARRFPEQARFGPVVLAGVGLWPPRRARARFSPGLLFLSSVPGPAARPAPGRGAPERQGKGRKPPVVRLMHDSAAYSGTRRLFHGGRGKEQLRGLACTRKSSAQRKGFSSNQLNKQLWAKFVFVVAKPLVLPRRGYNAVVFELPPRAVDWAPDE